MITSLDRNKLEGARRSLLNELAEESRLGNITPEKLESIANFIHEKHDECLIVVDKNDYYVEDIIEVYRSLVHGILKKI